MQKFNSDPARPAWGASTSAESAAIALFPVRARQPRRRIATIGRREHKTVCPETGKTRYRDRATAREALDSCRWQRTRELATFATTTRTETRIYRCPEPACNGGYHLTSLPAQRENVTYTGGAEHE